MKLACKWGWGAIRKNQIEYKNRSFHPIDPKWPYRWLNENTLGFSHEYNTVCTTFKHHVNTVLLCHFRYWAVTQVHYIHSRTIKTIGTMIALIWGISITVSLAPLFGWKDPDFEKRVNTEKQCIVSQDLSYQIFATMSTFYVPLVIILLLYWRIFMTARTRLRKRLAAKANVDLSTNGAGMSKPIFLTIYQLKVIGFSLMEFKLKCCLQVWSCWARNWMNFTWNVFLKYLYLHMLWVFNMF